MYCKWIKGSSLTDYSKNAKTWQEHTFTEEFVNTFTKIMEEYEEDNE